MSTNEKLKKLTEKIYNEGIEKANRDADKIIENAKKRADDIIKSAQKREKEMLEQLEKETKEMKKNTEQEIRLAAQQFINNIKQQVVELISYKKVDTTIDKAFDDKEFIQKMISTVVKNWNQSKNGEMDIRILLPEKDKNEMHHFFHSKAKNILDQGLEIEFVPNVKSGFKIGPQNGNYHISFTDEDFTNYFKSYVKDKTKKIIFEN